MSLSAALTLSLTGKYARQGQDAAEAVRLWAESAGVALTLVDDESCRSVAAGAYTSWVHEVDLLLGPYSSGLVRAVAPLAVDAGRLLWNHGGSADDLHRPGVATLLAPASRYFDGIVDGAAARGLERCVLVQGPGPFARAVVEGAAARAARQGIPTAHIETAAVAEQDTTGAAILAAGSFEHDTAVVRGLRDRVRPPELIGAVAAGIPAFGRELGSAAEGVLGPVHWWPTATVPEVGPSGVVFAEEFHRRTGREPSYVAAQAGAGAYLAHTAHQLGLAQADVERWRTSTMLGDFALDESWRQIGYRMAVVRWTRGSMVPMEHPRRTAFHEDQS